MVLNSINAHRFGSKQPCFFNTSATTGTREFTGFVMSNISAFGAEIAIAVARSLITLAFSYRK